MLLAMLKPSADVGPVQARAALFQLVYRTGPFKDSNPDAANWLMRAHFVAPLPRQNQNKKPRPWPGLFDPP
jgi:hypothetical protein